MKQIQQEVSARLLERLEYIKLKPQNILTIGDLTPECTQQLSNKYPTATITQTNNSNIAFELILATVADAQLNDFMASLSLLRQALTADGLLLFNCFAKNNISIDLHHIGDAMLNATLQDPVVDVERITIATTEFEVVYGHALGVPSHKPSVNSNGSVNVPVDSIVRL